MEILPSANIPGHTNLKCRILCKKNHNDFNQTCVRKYRLNIVISPSYTENVIVTNIYSPCRKCNGGSSNFFTRCPMKNLLPNNSGFIKVPYFGIPISKGLNSIHSAKKLVHSDQFLKMLSYTSFIQ